MRKVNNWLQRLAERHHRKRRHRGHPKSISASTTQITWPEWLNRARLSTRRASDTKPERGMQEVFSHPLDTIAELAAIYDRRYPENPSTPVAFHYSCSSGGPIPTCDPSQPQQAQGLAPPAPLIARRRRAHHRPREHPMPGKQRASARTDAAGATQLRHQGPTSPPRPRCWEYGAGRGRRNSVLL